MKAMFLVLALALSGSALGDMGEHGMEKKGMKSGSMPAMEKDRNEMPMNAPAGALAAGEVRKVDRDAGKITLRHGPAPSMGIPAMTMVYGVKDPSALEHLGVGDKVNFAAEKTESGYTVTRIERAK